MEKYIKLVATEDPCRRLAKVHSNTDYLVVLESASWCVPWCVLTLLGSGGDQS